MKVAVIFLSAFMDTIQNPVPEHPPPQPANELPLFGVAVKITELPASEVYEQVDPQLMPEGEPVTIPEPVPVFVTVKVYKLEDRAKLAVTVLAALIVVVHVPVPEHAPLQPEKVFPLSGVAVKMTEVPAA